MNQDESKPIKSIAKYTDGDNQKIQEESPILPNIVKDQEKKEAEEDKTEHVQNIPTIKVEESKD
jgi:hypothetical protein